jgi:predicted dehydrogenase
VPEKPIRFAIVGPGRIADRYLVPAWLGRGGSLERACRDLSDAHFVRHGAAAPDPARRIRRSSLIRPTRPPPRLTGCNALQAIQAARAGKHVLVEKPMATSVEEARWWTPAARRRGARRRITRKARRHRILARQARGGLGASSAMRVM